MNKSPSSLILATTVIWLASAFYFTAQGFQSAPEHDIVNKEVKEVMDQHLANSKADRFVDIVDLD